jgi:hypothetical protein
MAKEMPATLPFEHLELAYESLAQAIDKVGPANEALLLTKLVLILTHKTNDFDVFTEALKAAMQDLPG